MTDTHFWFVFAFKSMIQEALQNRSEGSASDGEGYVSEEAQHEANATGGALENEVNINVKEQVEIVSDRNGREDHQNDHPENTPLEAHESEVLSGAEEEEKPEVLDSSELSPDIESVCTDLARGPG